MKMKWWVILFLPMVFFSCSLKDYYRIPLYSQDHRMQAVVEIPAGTCQKIDYCDETHRFKILEEINENDSGFLAFPFNFGFIPSTQDGAALGAVADPIDVFILSEAIPTGEVLEILPVGLISIREYDQTVNKVIAIPFNKDKRNIDAEHFTDLQDHYPGVIRILEDWVENADPGAHSEILAWQDEILASKFIEALAVNQH
jgi:inorganic pyrophosphatase